MELGSVSASQLFSAVLPVVVLVGLVLLGKFQTGIIALISTCTAIVVGVVAFGGGPLLIAVAVGKGVWTGVWILYVIWTAMLLYQFASAAGLAQMGRTLSSVLPRDVENVLLVAWVFPSFVQGVAGFGTPIAVAAPLLLSMGLSHVRSVVLPLVGYHWAVTFGSMGSSFYMAALTAGLSADQVNLFAQEAALILSVNMLVAGGIVAVLYGGWSALQDSWRMLVFVGGTMFVVLNLMVRLEPSIGSVSAGAAGLAAAGVLRMLTREERAGTKSVLVGLRDSGGCSDSRDDCGDGGFTLEHVGASSRWRGRLNAVAPLAPYAVLLAAVLAVFLPPGSRSYVKAHLLVGPSFPSTASRTGMVNDAVDLYTPIALLGHPGTYILFAALAGVVLYRALGAWPRNGLGAAVREWAVKVRRSSFSVLALTTLATVMVDTGMVRVVATGAAAVAGSLYPVIAPVVGALGSFTTGSTTTSNALFAALQQDVASLIGIEGTGLLAAQTAGGNVGNSMAPVVILIGATAISAENVVGKVFRGVAWPCFLLLVVVALMTQYVL